MAHHLGDDDDDPGLMELCSIRKLLGMVELLNTQARTHPASDCRGMVLGGVKAPTDSPMMVFG